MNPITQIYLISGEIDRILIIRIILFIINVWIVAELLFLYSIYNVIAPNYQKPQRYLLAKKIAKISQHYLSTRPPPYGMDPKALMEKIFYQIETLRSYSIEKFISKWYLLIIDLITIIRWSFLWSSIRRYLY